MIPTFFIDDTAVTARKAEVPHASFHNGMNYGGSNAPAIGVNVGEPNLAGSPEQFTLLDQHGAARNPQTSQHIGGSGLGSGTSGTLPEANVRTGINDHAGDGTIGPTRQDVGLVSLAKGWEAPVV